MEKFTLDTSGRVVWPGLDGLARPHVEWSDLDAFTQGYIEALFASLSVDVLGQWLDTVDPYRTPAFRDLAAKTLDRIIADCAAKALELRCPLTAQDGGSFWRKFMSKALTPYLGDDDDKVHFA